MAGPKESVSSNGAIGPTASSLPALNNVEGREPRISHLTWTDVDVPEKVYLGIRGQGRHLEVPFRRSRWALQVAEWLAFHIRRGA